MYEKFLQAKNFISNFKSLDGEVVDQISIRYEADEIFLSGIWSGPNKKTITIDDTILVKNESGKYNKVLITKALKEIKYLTQDNLTSFLFFSFEYPLHDSLIQMVKSVKDLKDSICFSHNNLGLLNTFYPKDEFGQIKLSNSFHEHMAGNSILISKEKLTIQEDQIFYFKIDLSDKKYVHIFYRRNNQDQIFYKGRFEMNSAI